jgi:two-component system, cell cycle sensor histidine kinase PleC
MPLIEFKYNSINNRHTVSGGRGVVDRTVPRSISGAVVISKPPGTSDTLSVRTAMHTAAGAGWRCLSWRLGRKRIWWLTGLFLCLYNVTIGWQVYQQHCEADTRARNRTAHLADVLAERVTNDLDRVASSLEAIAVVWGGTQDGFGVTQALMRSSVARVPLVRGYVLVGQSGKMLLDENGLPADPLDLSDRDYFRAHSEALSDRVVVGRPVNNGQSGRWFLSVSRKLKDEDGDFAGVIAAVVEPLHLGEVLAQADLGTRGTATLAAADGTIIARSSDTERYIGQTVQEQDAGAANAAATEDLLASPGTVSSSGEVVERSAVAGFPIRVEVRLSRSEALALWWEDVPVYAAAMILPTLIGLVLVMVITRQQRALRHAETALQQHVTDLENSQHLLERRTAELGHLAQDHAAAQIRAEAALAMKHRFLATVSHELRTPLNAIIGFSEMLEQEFLGPLGAREYVEYARFVREGGETLLGLINGIIELSAIEAGEYVIRKEPMDLARVVATCLKSIEAAAQVQGVTLINTISHLPGIVADERAIRQVLLNLLANAVKFTPAGGRIEVTAEAEPDCLRLRISDTGVGIPEAAMEHLGSLFIQGDGDLSRQHGGIGIGLALCRRLMERHQDSLVISSTADVGTTAILTLSRRGEPYAAGQEPKSSSSRMSPLLVLTGS